MLKGYRRRFVAFNMLLVGVVLLVALVFQGVYLYRSAYNELQNTMRLIVEPLGGARMGGFRFDGAGDFPEEGLPERPFDANPRFAERGERRVSEEGILTVFYSAENDTWSLLSPESFLDEETLERAVRAAAEQTEVFGALSGLDLYYYKEGGADSSRIALADTAYLS